MSSVTTSFFAASSFSSRDPVSLSRLKLLPIPLILVATRHEFCLELLFPLEYLSEHELLCRDQVYLPVVMILVATSFFCLLPLSRLRLKTSNLF